MVVFYGLAVLLVISFMVAAVVLVVVLVSFLCVWFGGGVVLRIGVGQVTTGPGAAAQDPGSSLVGL